MKLIHQVLKLNVIAGLLILGACSDSTSPEPTGEALVPMPDMLVDAAWLKQHLGDPNLVVLDATVIVEPDTAGNLRTINGRANYESGHIPTAGFADLMGDLSDPESPLQFGMPSPEQFAAAMDEVDWI
jgi:thiosulfate/3-mercaptopyruvate sulfurtransferase